MVRLKAVGFVLLALVLAACLATPPGHPGGVQPRTIVAVVASHVAPANRTADQFYAVLVAGSEHARRADGKPAGPTVVCDHGWTYDLDADAKRVRYDASRFPFDARSVEVLVALDVHAPTVGASVGDGCGDQRLLSAFPGRAAFHARVRPDLAVDVVVEAQNGFLTFNRSYFLSMGQKVHVNYTRLVDTSAGRYIITGDADIVNLGAWPRSALEPTATGRR